MAIRPFCGKKTVEDAEFCPYCGKRVEGREVRARETASILEELNDWRRYQTFFVVLAFLSATSAGLLSAFHENPRAALGIALGVLSLGIAGYSAYAIERLKQRLKEK